MTEGAYTDELTPVLPESLATILKGEINWAFNNSEELENPFLVNDTQWFEQVGGKLKPRATNEAGHISKGFQRGLEKQGWKIDHDIGGQEIDGFKEFEFMDIAVDRLNEPALREQIGELPLDANFLKKFNTLYHCYFSRPLFLRAPGLEINGFQSECRSGVLKVGLEFETGNIASSFRALTKLRILYLKEKIDYGIFITSHSREVSTRIWPPANRNGSLDELTARQFLEDTQFPLLVCGFEPDGWDKDVGYLKKIGRDLTGPRIKGLVTKP